MGYYIIEDQPREILPIVRQIYRQLVAQGVTDTRQLIQQFNLLIIDRQTGEVLEPPGLRQHLMKELGHRELSPGLLQDLYDEMQRWVETEL